MGRQSSSTVDAALDQQIREAFSGKRILVTGGGGYLGSNLIALLNNVDCEIARLSRSERNSSANNDSVAVIEDVTADVRDDELWSRVLDGTDVVFHFAAQTSFYVANADAAEDHRSNVLPMLQMLETCRKQNWHPQIFFSGTVTQAGIPASLPVNESHPDNPITVYDLHKLMAERYLEYYADQRIVSGATLRLANIYGPGPASSKGDRGILNLMIRSALAGKDLTIYGEGQYLRDYSYVQDIARAFIEASLNIDKVNGRHFVIGSGEGYTIAESVDIVRQQVEKKTGKRVNVVHVDPPPGQLAIESRNFVADASQFKQATGWRPSLSFRDGIDQTIEAFS